MADEAPRAGLREGPSGLVSSNSGLHVLLGSWSSSRKGASMKLSAADIKPDGPSRGRRALYSLHELVSDTSDEATKSSANPPSMRAPRKRPYGAAPMASKDAHKKGLGGLSRAESAAAESFGDPPPIEHEGAPRSRGAQNLRRLSEHGRDPQGPCPCPIVPKAPRTRPRAMFQ